MEPSVFCALVTNSDSASLKKSPTLRRAMMADVSSTLAGFAGLTSVCTSSPSHTTMKVPFCTLSRLEPLANDLTIAIPASSSSSVEFSSLLANRKKGVFLRYVFRVSTGTDWEPPMPDER
eukprot:5440525-Prymnesium_polylepis.1